MARGKWALLILGIKFLRGFLRLHTHVSLSDEVISSDKLLTYFQQVTAQMLNHEIILFDDGDVIKNSERDIIKVYLIYVELVCLTDVLCLCFLAAD